MRSRLIVTVAGALVLVGAIALGALGTSRGPSPSAGADTLEGTPVARNTSIEALPGARSTAIGMTLRDLIRDAYATREIQTTSQIVGGPAWIGADRFEVVAKANELQTVLADRFKLRVHTETRERPVYELVVAAGAFDFRLQFVGAIVSRHEPSVALATPAVEASRNLFSALHGPFGFRLESRQTPVHVIVVDHAEPPSET